MMEDQTELACIAVLSDYSSYLKEEYDIYAFSAEDYLLEKKINELIRNNLSTPLFYQFKVESVSITKENPLMNTDILKQGIQRTMKDSIYETIITEVYDRLSVISSVGEAIDIIRTKMRFDEKLKSINEALAMLKTLTEGNGSDLFINILKNDSVIKSYIDDFFVIYDRLMAVDSRIMSLKDNADESIYEIELLLQEKGTLKEKMTDIYYLHINDFIEALINLNHQAFMKIKEIILDCQELHFVSGSIKNAIDEMESCPLYLKEIAKYIASMTESVENALAIETLEILENKIAENISALSRTGKNMENIYEAVIEDSADITSYNHEGFTGYNSDLSVMILDDTVYGQMEDRRSFFEKLGEEILHQQFGEDVIIDDNIILPSKQEEQEVKLFDIEVSNDSSDEASESLSSAKMTLSGALAKLKEQAFLNEYLIQKLGSQTESGLENSFFRNEIEYILFGNRSQHMNSTFTKSAIMLIRFALDTIHVYSDPEKQIKANAIAATVAGWWTFGAGIPVISNLVSCAWAIAEAGYDVKALVEGESLPVYKLTGDWKLDIGLNQASAKTPKILQIDYEDYLRILLLSKNEEDKLKRLLDIMKLNAPVGFELENAYTQVTVKAVISQRSFLGKRHYFEVEKTAGY